MTLFIKSNQFQIATDVINMFDKDDRPVVSVKNEWMILFILSGAVTLLFERLLF